MIESEKEVQMKEKELDAWAKGDIGDGRLVNDLHDESRLLSYQEEAWFNEPIPNRCTSNKNLLVNGQCFCFETSSEASIGSSFSRRLRNFPFYKIYMRLTCTCTTVSGGTKLIFKTASTWFATAVLRDRVATTKLLFPLFWHCPFEGVPTKQLVQTGGSCRFSERAPRTLKIWNILKLQYCWRICTVVAWKRTRMGTWSITLNDEDRNRTFWIANKSFWLNYISLLYMKYFIKFMIWASLPHYPLQVKVGCHRVWIRWGNFTFWLPFWNLKTSVHCRN